MIKKLAARICQLCVQNGLPKEKTEIYEYGLECAIMEILGNLILFVVAGFFGFLWHSILWTIGLCCIRYYAGGFHAKTYKRCLLISTMNGLLFSGFVKYTAITYSTTWMLLLVSILILLITARVGSEQKPLTTQSKIYRRKRLYLVSTLLSVVIIVSMYFFPLWIAGSLASGFFSAALACIVGTIMKRKKNYCDYSSK